MDRFDVVIEQSCCWIRDCMHKEYKAEKRAVAINFKTKLRADTVCDIMNREWREFLRYGDELRPLDDADVSKRFLKT